MWLGQSYLAAALTSSVDVQQQLKLVLPLVVATIICECHCRCAAARQALHIVSVHAAQCVLLGRESFLQLMPAACFSMKPLELLPVLQRT
jgi:hypothetical protein